MTVNVKFIGSFRSLSGKNKVELSVEGSSPIREVVKMIVEELPRLLRALIDSECESLKTNMLVLVNGKELSVLECFETMIIDGDEVVFVPVVHGG